MPLQQAFAIAAMAQLEAATPGHTENGGCAASAFDSVKVQGMLDDVHRDDLDDVELAFPEFKISNHLSRFDVSVLSQHRVMQLEELLVAYPAADALPGRRFADAAEGDMAMYGCLELPDLFGEL